MPDEDSTSLRRTLIDISRGYSESTYEQTPMYIKHLGLINQDELDRRGEKIAERYKKSGLRCRDEILEECKQNGTWTDENEKEIEKQEQFITTLQNTYKSLLIPSQKEKLQDRIEALKKEIGEKKNKKRALLTESREAFTERRISDLTILHSLFRDKKLEDLFFSPEDFDELERGEIYGLVGLYNEAFDSLSIENIKLLSLSGMFSNYYSVVEKNPCTMFNRGPLELTFFQLNLLNYAQVFKSIFKNIPNIPDEIKSNPDKLLEFAESGHKNEQKARELQKKGGDRTRAGSIMGASKEDMEKMGMDISTFTSPEAMMKKMGKSSMSTLDGDF
jgi:hypothetical protein